jgi:hypothetical protein
MSEGDQQRISQELSLLDKAVLAMIMAQQPLASILESLCLKIEDIPRFGLLGSSA